MAISRPPGLRERKKAQTRQAISDTATRLFIARGFDHVTVAEIAEAADVSVKTVFNYFPAKEDLFFDRAEQLVRTLEDTIRGRGDLPVSEALRKLLSGHRIPIPGDGWRLLDDPEAYRMICDFIACEHGSPALRARKLVMLREWEPRVAAAIADAVGRPAGDGVCRTYAAFVIALCARRDQVMSASMLEGVKGRTVERRVRQVVDDGCARLAQAFADVDRG